MRAFLNVTSNFRQVPATNLPFLVCGTLFELSQSRVDASLLWESSLQPNPPISPPPRIANEAIYVSPARAGVEDLLKSRRTTQLDVTVSPTLCMWEGYIQKQMIG